MTKMMAMQGRDGEKILKDFCLLFRTVHIPGCN